MMSERAVRRAGSSLLLGYLPLVLGAIAIVVMVIVVPSEVPAPEGAAGGNQEAAGPPISGGTNGSQPGTGPSTPGATAPPDTTGQTASGWGDTVTPCKGKKKRQTDSGYSPPCVTFDGDNGGETATGVTADTIKVSYRNLSDGHLLETLGALAGVSIGEGPDDLWRTTQGLVDYFNENYEFYGRKIELVRFDGNGTLTQELTGAGQEAAQNDALTAVDNGVFADINNGLLSSQPYAEALTVEEVVSIGVPYMSRQWFADRAPYAWSAFPDCTLVAEVAALVGNAVLLDEPAALAGGRLKDRDRKLGVVHPNSQEYTSCVDRSNEILEEEGHAPALVQNYNLDLAATDANATSILAKLKSEDITSVACGCDPLMVRALATKAEQQDYHPEWFILGVGFVDLDLVGQLIASTSGDQWSHAVGGSPAARPEEFEKSEAYRAYESVRDDTPSQTVSVIYTQLLRLAIGIQMAGPELTPENFQTGMYSYPEGSGPFGAWDFTPENQSGLVDVRLVYWNKDGTSPFNGKKGTYIDTGERFRSVEDAPTQDELITLGRKLDLVE